MSKEPKIRTEVNIICGLYYIYLAPILKITQAIAKLEQSILTMNIQTAGVIILVLSTNSI
jgi:hypothetical protein